MLPLTIASWLEHVPFDEPPKLCAEHGGVANNGGGLIARDLADDHINTKWGCGVCFQFLVFLDGLNELRWVPSEYP